MSGNPKKSVAPNALEMFNSLPNLSPQNKAEALAVISSNEIRIGAFLWTPIGLQVDGQIKRQDWEETGRLLQRLDVSLQWIIGDWIVAADELEYGDREQFATTLGFNVKTIYEYSYVAKHVEFSIRMENLPFKHHQLVAGKSPEEQAHWLNRALQGDDGKAWSAARLAAEMKGSTHSEESNFDLKPYIKVVKQAGKFLSAVEPINLSKKKKAEYLKEISTLRQLLDNFENRLRD